MNDKIQNIIWKLEMLPASDLLTEVIVELSELIEYKEVRDSE